MTSAFLRPLTWGTQRGGRVHAVLAWRPGAPASSHRSQRGAVPAGTAPPGTPTTHPDAVPRRQRTPCPSRIHQQATAISVGRRRRPAQARIADRSDEPIAPWAACRPPNVVHHKELGPTGGGGRPTGQRARARATGPDHRGLTVAVAGWSVAAFAQTAFGIPILRHFGSTTSWSRHFGHLVPTSDIGGTDHAVPRAAASARTPTTPAYPYTGVALPGRSHVRVCRPVFMLCPARIAGIRCFAFSGHSDHMPCTTAVPGRRCGDSCLTRYLPSA